MSDPIAPNEETILAQESSVPTQKKSFSKVSIIFGSLFILLIISALFIYKTSFLQISSVPLKPISTTPLPITSESSSEKSKKLFPIVDESLLKFASSDQLKPEQGYQLVSSLLSPDASKIAFTEVSLCFTQSFVDCNEKRNYDQSITCETCDWNFKVGVQDLATSQPKILFETKKPAAESSIIVKQAFAGGMPIVAPFPIGWVPNGEDIITQDAVLMSMPMGGGREQFGMINIKTGVMHYFNENVAGFDKSFSKYLTIPGVECGEGYRAPYGDTITAKSLPDKKTIRTMKGDYYGFPRFDDEGEVITFEKIPLKSSSKYIGATLGDDISLCDDKMPTEFTQSKTDLSKPVATPTPTTAPKSISTASYTESKSGLTFQYPSTWTIETNPGSDQVATLKDNGNLAMTIIRKDNSSNEFETIEAYGKSTNLPLQPFTGKLVSGLYSEISGSRQFIVFSQDKRYIMTIIINSKYNQDVISQIGDSLRF